ncbi:MAG: hypothetical protein KGH71_01355 [Candidatus Micrarchaeota archaeon]|nr:hypothetical protein [Candidatus Micrarchaeota archaeon]
MVGDKKAMARAIESKPQQPQTVPLVPLRDILLQAKAEVSEGVDPAKTLALLRWPNQRGEENRMVLHEVTKDEAILIDRLLGIPGIRQNARDSKKNMPTHRYCEDGNVYAMAKMIMNGADIQSANDEGKTPADKARDAGHYGLADFVDNLATLPLEKRIAEIKKINFLISPLLRY